VSSKVTFVVTTDKAHRMVCASAELLVVCLRTYL